MLLNLIINACDAMANTPPENRQITLRTELDPDGWVRISIADREPGIAPGHREQVFNPFYTTKPQGLGLGLSMCRTIVTAHRGRIWIADKPGPGATIPLALPRIFVDKI